MMLDRLCIGLSVVIVLASIIDNTVVNYLDSDMSWLLIVADRLMAGDKLYVDIWETNPPLPALLYFPHVWISSVSGLKAEMLVGLSAYLWMALCFWFAGSLALKTRVIPGRHLIWLLPVGLASLLWSIPHAFAEREFYAAPAALPMLAVAMARAECKQLPPPPPSPEGRGGD